MAASKAVRGSLADDCVKKFGSICYRFVSTGNWR
jgi:hypothetical protein